FRATCHHIMRSRTQRDKPFAVLFGFLSMLPERIQRESTAADTEQSSSFIFYIRTLIEKHPDKTFLILLLVVVSVLVLRSGMLFKSSFVKKITRLNLTDRYMYIAGFCTFLAILSSFFALLALRAVF
ncbi:hypothetical protein, partial [uncultured Rhodospira sp.]|uniref:hypothetical protein n=1 Tax=uncultured Rhodospira sp. TaxID=1936189 RepID=UPI002614FC67